MNNPNFRNNDDMKKQNRIVYTVLSLSLAVLAILISISVIFQRNKAEPSTEKKPETTVKAPVTTERKPETTEKKDETTAAPESSDTADADADAGADAAADVLPDFIAPVPGAVIKGYSTSVPVYSQTMDDYRVHSGVDLAASIGDKVYAAATGTVGAVWEDPMNGCSLTLIHKGGAVSTYSNLSKETLETVKPGMSILGGDVIATVGDTSLTEIADEAHLHYELTVNQQSVNPAEYMTFPESSENYEG